MAPALVPYLPEEERMDTLLRALAAVESLEWEHSRVQALCNMVPYLPQAVLAAAERLKDKREQADVLIDLIPYLQESDRADAIKRVLAAVKSMEDNPRSFGEWEASMLAALAPYQPEVVLATAEGFKHEHHRVRALVNLAPYMPESVLAEAERLTDEEARAEVFGALAGYLSTLLGSTLFARWEVIVSILKGLNRSASYSTDALGFIAELIPVVRALGGEAAQTQTLDAVETVCTWWP
jgi:hypothetical protein